MRNEDFLKEIYDIKTWQGLHVNQLAYTRNLFIILSTALQGFIYSQHVNSNPLFWSSLLLALSTGIGILIAVLESENYRKKYRLSRMVKKQMDDKGDFGRIEGQCTNIENANRILFFAQAAMFLAGAIVLAFTHMS